MLNEIFVGEKLENDILCNHRLNDVITIQTMARDCGNIALTAKLLEK